MSGNPREVEELGDRLQEYAEDGFIVLQIGPYGRREIRLTPKAIADPYVQQNLLTPLYNGGVTWLGIPNGMRRTRRRMSQPDILSPGHDKECTGGEVSTQSVPAIINVEESTAGVAAGGAMAAASGAMVASAGCAMDNSTTVSSLGSPVAVSKQSKEIDDDDYSSSDDDKKMAWDQGEGQVNLGRESYSYTGVKDWAVYGDLG